MDRKLSSKRAVKSKARRQSATSGPKTSSADAEQSTIEEFMACVNFLQNFSLLTDSER